VGSIVLRHESTTTCARAWRGADRRGGFVGQYEGQDRSHCPVLSVVAAGQGPKNEFSADQGLSLGRMAAGGGGVYGTRTRAGEREMKPPPGILPSICFPSFPAASAVQNIIGRQKGPKRYRGALVAWKAVYIHGLGG